MIAPQPSPSVSVDDRVTPLLHRVRSEFLEMPGLCLTLAQASRLWSLDRMTSEHVLQLLVESGFLTRSRDGAFFRVSWP